MMGNRKIDLRPLFLAVMMAGCGGGKPPTKEEPPVPMVKAVRADEKPMAEWTELFGVTQPLPTRVARVTAGVEGRVLPWGIDGSPALAEGQIVKAGQVLLRLDDRVIRANRDKLRAAVKD